MYEPFFLPRLPFVRHACITQCAIRFGEYRGIPSACRKQPRSSAHAIPIRRATSHLTLELLSTLDSKCTAMITFISLLPRNIDCTVAIRRTKPQLEIEIQIVKLTTPSFTPWNVTNSPCFPAICSFHAIPAASHLTYTTLHLREYASFIMCGAYRKRCGQSVVNPNLPTSAANGSRASYPLYMAKVFTVKYGRYMTTALSFRCQLSQHVTS